MIYLVRVAYRGDLSYRYIDHLSIDISTETHILLKTKRQSFSAVDPTN